MPIATGVMARPVENALTRVIPDVSFPRCRQRMNILIAAGQGIRPPDDPRRMVSGTGASIGETRANLGSVGARMRIHGRVVQTGGHAQGGAGFA